MPRDRRHRAHSQDTLQKSYNTPKKESLRLPITERISREPRVSIFFVIISPNMDFCQDREGVVWKHNRRRFVVIGLKKVKQSQP